MGATELETVGVNPMQGGGDHGLYMDCLKVTEPTCVIRANVMIDCTTVSVRKRLTVRLVIDVKG